MLSSRYAATTARRSASAFAAGITVSGLRGLMRELKWYEKELGSADAPVLGLVLKSDVLIKLEVLWLNYNHLGDDGAIELALAVGSGSMPRLRKLELRHGEIGDAGLRALSHATCTGSGALKKLETLDLSENRIGDGGVCAFASALTTGALPRLSLLDLDDNEIGAAGVYALMAAAAHKTLFGSNGSICEGMTLGGRAPSCSRATAEGCCRR